MKRIIEISVFIAGFLLLVWLGCWQLQRAVWKKDILDRIEREYAKDASAYTLTPEDLLSTDKDEFKVVRGTVSGRFIPDSTLYWPSPYNGIYGFQIMDPLVLSDGDVLMVNRGWVSEVIGERRPSREYTPPYDITVEVSGLARQMTANYFTLDNDPVANRWHRFKPEQIARYLNVNKVLPIVLFAEQITNVKYQALANTERSRIYPRNSHNQYAMFWFVLSGLWILIIGTKVFKKTY